MTPKLVLLSNPFGICKVLSNGHPDESHASNEDLSSNIDYLIMLLDTSSTFQNLDKASRKSERVFFYHKRKTCTFFNVIDEASTVATNIRANCGA